MTSIMRQVQASTMQRLLAAERLQRALETEETQQEPAERIVETVRRISRRYKPATPPIAALPTTVAAAT